MNKPWYAQLWPWLLMLGPVSVLVAGGFTMWLAFARQDALVVGDYYKQGMAINQDLRRDRAAARLGLKAVLQYDAVGGVLKGAVSCGGGNSCAGDLVIRLVHSTQPEKDTVLKARCDGAGNFSIALPLLDMARWQVEVEDEARTWRLHGAWPWPRERKITLLADGAPAE